MNGGFPMKKASSPWTDIEHQTFIKHVGELENEQSTVEAKDQLNRRQFYIAISARLASEGTSRSAAACVAAKRRYFIPDSEVDHEPSAEEDTEVRCLPHIVTTV